MRLIFLFLASLGLSAGGVRAGTATSLVLTSSCPTSGETLPVAFHATVQTGGVIATAATGTVIFLNNGVAFSSASLVNGEAYSATVANLPLGATTLTAEYAGDGQYGASTGGPLNQTVVAKSGAVFASSNLSLTFNTSAAVTSVRCIPVNQEINSGSLGFYIYHKLTNTTVPLNNMAQLGNNQVLVWSADGTYYAIFLVVPNGGYFKIELVHVSNNMQTGDIDGTWPGHDVAFSLNLATPTGYTMQNLSLDGMASWPGAVRNWYYTGGGIKWLWENVEYSQTTKRVAGTGSRTFPISAPEPMGAIAFYLSSGVVEHDDILMDMWSAEPAIPRPNRVNQPTWTRADVSAWLDRYERELVSGRTVIFEAKTPADFYSVADRMFAAGLDELYLFNAYWGGNQSVDEISTTWFPNGLSDLKALQQYCAQRGIRLDLHAMSGFLSLADPNFGPLSPTGLSSEVSRWATGTLLDPVTAGSTSFRVQPDSGCQMIVSPPPWGLYSRLYPPYYLYTQGLVSIGNDIISATTSQVGPSEWNVSNVSRSGLTQYGAKWGTNHPAGSRIDFLLTRDGNTPMVDSRSNLLTNLGTRYASLINTLDLTGQNYDGQEFNYDLSFVWGAAKFARRVSELADHPTLTECSSGFPSSGHFESVFNRISNQFAGSGDFAAHIRLNDPEMIATSIDEVNFTFGRCAAAGQRYRLIGNQIGLPLNTIDNYGPWSQATASLELWAALGPYLTSTQKSALATWGSDFYEPTETPTQWQVTPKRAMLRPATDVGWSNMQEWGPISPRQFHKAGDVISGLNNPYAAQTPQIELFVLPGMSATNAANVSLMPASASDLIQPATVTQPVTFSGGAINLAANSSGLFTPDGTTQAYWNYKVAGAVTKLDMSASRGIAVTVTGDNSGADLVFRISSSSDNSFSLRNRDYVLPLDFSGTRTIEIPNGEVMWNKTAYGFMNDYSTVGMNVDYKSVSGFQVFIGKVPTGKTASVQITAIKAMQEDRSVGLVNPSLVLNGNTVTITGTIPYNNYLLYGGGPTAKVYDGNWHYISDLPASSAALSAVTGLNTFSVSAAGSTNAWLATRVKVSGTPWVIDKPATAHEWRFESNTLDSVGTAHGTAVNGPSYVSGKEGSSALIFNGTNQYVTVPDAADLRFTSTQSFTLTAWVKLNSLPSAWTGIVNKGRGNYGIWLTPANQWAFGGTTDLVSSVTATTGEWSLLTAVQDGAKGTRKLYVNGSLVVSGWAQASAANNDFLIGAATDTTPGNFFNGAVDDVRLYNLALGTDDIRKQVEGPRQPNEIRNHAATGIGSTTAALNATLAGAGADYQVHACWGTVSGGTSAAQWTHTADLGTFTNAVWTNLISHTPAELLPDTQYYFTTYATNPADSTTLWAPQVLSFKTLNVTPVATPQNVTVVEDTEQAITLTGSASGGGALTYGLRTYPAHGSLSGVPPNVTYTPSANYYGADGFSFVVNDGSQDSAVATVSLTMSPVNDAPVATGQSLFTLINTARAITLNGTDPDNDPLTSVVVTQPAHGTLTGIAPNLLYTPDAGYSGLDAFTFKVNDGLLNSVPATIAIVVRAPKTVTWDSANSTTTDWALGTNWIGSVAPVAGDDVVVTADGTFDPTVNSAYTGIAINSLTLQGSNSLTLGSTLQVGAGGVYNTMASNSLFLTAVNLTSDQTWGGTRTIFVGGAITGSKMTFNGSGMRIDSNNPAWSGGLDVRTTLGMGGGFAIGAITPFGTGTVTLINQKSAGSTASSPALGFAGPAANNSLANAQTLANTIALSDPGSTGNFSISQSTDAATGTAHYYILSGNITGAVNSARTLSFANTKGSAATTPAMFVLTGANTYNAQTVIGTNTTLQIGNGGTDGTLGASSINNTGTLAFSRSDALSVGNVISGAGQLQQIGAGTTTLTGSNTYTGATTISAGTLQLGNGGTTGSLATASAITNNATLAFNRSNALTQGTHFASVIGGTGGLQQLGAGTTTLTGGNTYTGATTISAGTLQLGNGGTTGSLATASAITNNATLAFNRSNALTQGTDFASVIGGTGGLQQLGAGTTTLSGNNSYSGTTSVIAGVLRASHANALGTTAGGTSVTSGAALELIGGIAIGAEALGLNGSGITSAGALRNISGTNSHAGLITLNGATRINSDSGLLTLSGGFSGAQNLTIGGAGGTTLSGDLAIGAGTLTKDAAGVLTLSAASTRSGGTAFSGATLVVGAQGALGSGSVTGTSSSVLAFNTATNATFSNAMTLASAEQNSIRNNSTNSTVTLNGNIAGSGPSFFTFVGTGASNAGFVLGGSNTFTGTRVVVKDTSLTIANNSAVNAPSFPRVSLGDAGGSGAAVYLLDGINLNVKVVDANNTAITGPMAFTVGMKTAGTSTISGTSTANVAIDLHALSTGGTNNTWKFEAVSGATANFTGAIINTGTNAQAPITKTGLGTVVFSGANTYGGDTTVEAGTLSLATARLHDASTVRIASGAVLALTHGLSDRVDKLYLNGVYQPAGTYGATTPGGYISGSGSLLVTNGPTNDAPLANNQTLATPMDTVTPLVLTGTDPEGAALTFHILENPSHGTLTGTAPNLNYMPATGFVGVDRLTFTVNDGILTSSAATVLISVTPVTVAGLWQAYETAILNAPLNKELLLTSVQGAITIEQIRYDLGELVGTQVTASPKIAAYYAYPTTGTNLPGIVAIHGGGQQASVSEAVYWASQGYACMSINWGGNPLTDLAGGSLLPNTDWDQLAAGFTRTGVTQAIDHESTSPASFSDGVTLFAEPHPFNNSYCLYSYAARRAMTYLAAQPNVNGNKLGVTGHSMGGVITVMTGTDSRATCITPSVGGVVAEQNSYWPEIHCPTLFLEASNDWHAPFDQVVTSMALQAESVPQRLAVAPHFSHRFNTTAEAARVLWQKAHLTESFAFPQTATAQLDLTQSDGIPVFSVWPDESTASTVVGVDVYYGYDRDPLARFWRDGQAVKINGHWQAKCPVYDLNEPLVAFAVVTYDCGFNFTMQAGYTSPTRNFSVASEVRRVDPPDLSASGVRATEIRLPQIDDFARAYHDWYLLESASTTYFECWTRKLLDPSWAGPAGGELAFDVLTTSPGNVLGVKILVGQNDMNAQTYVAIIPVTANGTNSVSIPVGAFTHEITGAALANWGRLPVLGVMTGKRAKPGDATLPTWTGSVPVLSNLRWVGGSYPENYLIHDVPKAWLIGYGLAATDAVALADSDGDGKSNWEEFIAGTHPLNAALLLKMEAAGVAADRFVFKWQAVSGKTYRIETKTNLMDPAWTVLQTGIPGVAPECTGSVPMSGTSGFIRVAVE